LGGRLGGLWRKQLNQTSLRTWGQRWE